ncbi:MAG TPA: NUDIX domain-containing protein [Gammaproteobacteria bacterium]|jgi:ADP-ribose pyrophosphatase|nr:NUDIX domain-containing protein [Gammaproteobacteria bacterium]
MEESLQIFSAEDYEIVKREVMYQGVFRLTRYHLRHRCFNGDWTTIFTREVLERKSAAAILLYDPILDQVVLIQQFRPGILANTQIADATKNPWVLEVVAGVFDADETAEELVKREAEEEAGCTVLDILPICRYFVSPGGSNEHLHLFCGRIDASNAGGIHGLVQENENIRAVPLTTEKAFALLKAGEINTSPAIIALQWLQLHRDGLRQLWQKK